MSAPRLIHVDDSLPGISRERSGIGWRYRDAKGKVIRDREEIDRLNILHATMLAMQRAVEGLHVTPKLALIDGNRCPKLAVPASPVVKGDSQVPAIAAASILAKVTRDREMSAFELIYPGYGIGGHKGYPTPVHLEALERLGPTPIHRRSFGPVRAAWEAREGLIDSLI